MKTKTMTVALMGYLIQGQALLSLWGGGKGWIQMEPTFIPIEKFSLKTFRESINDAGFGCESIEEAHVDVFEQYEYGAQFLRKTIHLDEISIR